jgi:hypothetical protein
LEVACSFEHEEPIAIGVLAVDTSATARNKALITSTDNFLLIAANPLSRANGVKGSTALLPSPCVSSLEIEEISVSTSTKKSFTARGRSWIYDIGRLVEIFTVISL